MSKAKQILILAKRLGRRAIGQRANRLLSISIIVCTCVAASLGLFAKSVQTALNYDIANYLGASLVVRADQDVLKNIYRDVYDRRTQRRRVSKCVVKRHLIGLSVTG